MKMWVRDRLRDFGVLLSHNWHWWWDRRLRVADWCYAVFTLPFSGLMMVAGTGAASGLLTGPIAAVMGLFSNALVALPLVFLLFVVPGVLGSAAMLWRRSEPKWLMVTGALMMALYANPIPLMVGLYSYPAHFSERKPLVSWFVLGLLTTGIIYHQTPVAFVVLSVFYLVLPVIAGLWIGTRRQLIDRLKERAERLEREQHMMAEQAIGAERTRIAREMHDVVAHRVSLMVLHAGGLEVSATEPRTVEAAGLIRTTGREALAELRGILGVLRDDGTDTAPTAPQPVLDDLERLINEWRGAGMRVDREETGTVGPLPTAVQRTAFRIVQEGLTNAAKHATGAAVQVWLHYGEDRLEVEVVNDPVTGPVHAPPRSGYGLTGLRERVVLAGGELSAGACPDGGWRMRAILPVGEEGPEEAPTPEPHTTEVEEEEGAEGDPHTPGR
ncbi:sensor histidine kinase [Nocardiopsis exhalans]|uniref:histidine kinase n=2 Tax=Nocardiopsis TaxID=2013 RepID=A0A840WH76_9ACTN|nr:MULTISPECIES: sensor histidine kinase [Nocardiopsis]MBB5491057.1 signal transduction histidine kinase [Nocardiopsis metallicus]USY17633.1 sensor histidine kinase [Nocardiopsis exhalans]